MQPYRVSEKFVDELILEIKTIEAEVKQLPPEVQLLIAKRDVLMAVCVTFDIKLGGLRWPQAIK